MENKDSDAMDALKDDQRLIRQHLSFMHTALMANVSRAEGMEKRLGCIETSVADIKATQMSKEDFAALVALIQGGRKTVRVGKAVGQRAPKFIMGVAGLATAATAIWHFLTGKGS